LATARADGIPGPCAKLAVELKDLQSELAGLQADLQNAVGGSQKSSIAGAIGKKNLEIFAKQKALDACIAQNQSPPTPNPTYSFDTGTGATMISIGGSPADSNIAASSTHICLTARGAFACYTKGGTLVSPGPGFDTRPYNAGEFFEKSGFTITPPPSGTLTKDGRVVFDQYHKRFFMVFQAREPITILNRLLIAVSKSEDPRDGWWTYADTVGTQKDPGQDYQWLGVNSTYLLVANNQGKGQPLTKYYYMYPTADLAAGKPYSRLDPKISAPNAVPCVHDTTTQDAFWVQRDDSTHASVWAVRNGQVTSRQVKIQTSTGPVGGVELGGETVDYNHIIGWTPQNAQFRNGRIAWVSNDGHTWAGQSSSNSAVRLVQLNVTKFFDSVPSITVEIDRVFGRASVGDPAGVVYDYGWPAVATNANSDIVVGSVRSHPTIFPECRASVWLAGQPDISSSVLLAKSTSPLTEFHMAGACADPATSAVYLSQQYGISPSSWVIHVAKMLGSVMPDVIATQVQPPAMIAPGASGKLTVTIVNQGDGPMPASQCQLYLSTDNTITVVGPDTKADTLLATFSVPALKPNQAATPVVPFTLAATQAPGKYFVGVRLDTFNAANEYSEINNLNPFVVGDHGNAPITIK
jgi:hypothetical protein